MEAKVDDLLMIRLLQQHSLGTFFELGEQLQLIQQSSLLEEGFDQPTPADGGNCTGAAGGLASSDACTGLGAQQQAMPRSSCHEGAHAPDSSYPRSISCEIDLAKVFEDFCRQPTVTYEDGIGRIDSLFLRDDMCSPVLGGAVVHMAKRGLSIAAAEGTGQASPVSEENQHTPGTTATATTITVSPTPDTPQELPMRAGPTTPQSAPADVEQDEAAALVQVEDLQLGEEGQLPALALPDDFTAAYVRAAARALHKMGLLERLPAAPAGCSAAEQCAQALHCLMASLDVLTKNLLTALQVPPAAVSEILGGARAGSSKVPEGAEGELQRLLDLKRALIATFTKSLTAMLPLPPVPALPAGGGGHLVGDGAGLAPAPAPADQLMGFQLANLAEKLALMYERCLKQHARRLWARMHWQHPVPSKAVKLSLAQYQGSTFRQVSDWFTNYRARIWKDDILHLAKELRQGGDAEAM